MFGSEYTDDDLREDPSPYDGDDQEDDLPEFDGDDEEEMEELDFDDEEDGGPDDEPWPQDEDEALGRAGPDE